MLQTLRQTMEAKLQVMSALCIKWRHIGELKRFFQSSAILELHGGLWSTSRTDHHKEYDDGWAPQPVQKLEGRQKCNFCYAHKYSQPRADFHQKRKLATFGRHGLIVGYALTWSVEFSEPIFTNLAMAQYTFVRIDFRMLKKKINKRWKFK